MICKPINSLVITMVYSLGFSQVDSTLSISIKGNEEIIRYHLKQQDPNFIEDMATDRPHQTETASIIPINHFQIESGTSIEINTTNTTKEIDYVYNSLLLKYGIGNGMDLRASIDILQNELYHNEILNKKLRGFSGVSIGGKKFLVGERGLRPKISLLGELYLPYFGKKEFRPSFTGGTIRFLFEHSISRRIELEYNIGPDWNGESPNMSYFYATSITVQLHGPLSFYGESFGFLIENSGKHSFTLDARMDSGFVYLIKKNIQLDLEGGLGFSKVSPDYFIATGISLRFPN